MEGTTPASGTKPSIKQQVEDWLAQYEEYAQPSYKHFTTVSTSNGPQPSVYHVLWTNATGTLTHGTTWSQTYEESVQ